MDVLASAITAVQLAISAAPKVEEIVVEGKAFIASLFSAGIITQGQQNDAHAHVDAYAAAVNAGTPPPEFTVEPDPS